MKHLTSLSTACLIDLEADMAVDDDLRRAAYDELYSRACSPLSPKFDLHASVWLTRRESEREAIHAMFDRCEALLTEEAA